MFRSGRTRPAHARSSGSETLLRIRSLAGYIIGTLESRFRKRQAATRVMIDRTNSRFDLRPERVAADTAYDFTFDRDTGRDLTDWALCDFDRAVRR